MLPTYANRLKEARLKANLTQVQVKQHTGINNKTLSGYENGVSEPDYGTLKQLCDLYDVTTDWVLGNTNNPHSSLTSAEREAANRINLNDDSFLDLNFTIDGKELTEAQKQKVLAMARLLLQQDQ
ncbi:helix-turn-helix domain-containing protein [Paenibacillus cineris]|jgi:transcriptional regulator with XRE-family HTH domain|uniref:Transcriptional regulator n=1 Tax=Paenibacillus cineris TaxID=237530 RepID=A0ABQ4LN58_9BACL|nr:helix-turn-helix transcriptional regulator [Paenibacillus cineris]GIO57954.1 transcriptional regulator [Paenibacillus cineris]